VKGHGESLSREAKKGVDCQFNTTSKHHGRQQEEGKKSNGAYGTGEMEY
jgi:hypothetical protein